MNETIVVEDGHAAVATVAVSGTLMPESSATDIITTVQTNNGKQAAVKVYNIGGGGGGGDYLPLSGGTLTGTLNARSILPHQGNPSYSLGARSQKWYRIYTNILNNGEDLIVPTEGGTLARIEDIDAAVGDISTALTAILGE